MGSIGQTTTATLCMLAVFLVVGWWFPEQYPSNIGGCLEWVPFFHTFGFAEFINKCACLKWYVEQFQSPCYHLRICLIRAPINQALVNFYCLCTFLSQHGQTGDWQADVLACERAKERAKELGLGADGYVLEGGREVCGQADGGACGRD